MKQVNADIKCFLVVFNFEFCTSLIAEDKVFLPTRTLLLANINT